MKSILRLPTVANVALGQRCVITCPVGLTYDAIVIDLGADSLAAYFTNVRLLINGKVEQEYASLTELKALNDVYGRDGQSRRAVLWFRRPELTNEAQRSLLALGTADVQTLSVEMDIAADMGAGVSPSVTAYGVMSEARPLGAYTKVRRFPRSFSAGGVQEFDSIPRTGGRIAAVHFITSGTINNIQVVVDNQTAIDAPTALLADLTDTAAAFFRNVANPTSYGYVLDFLGFTNALEDALITEGVADLRFKLDLAAAQTVAAVVEYIDGFQRS